MSNLHKRYYQWINKAANGQRQMNYMNVSEVQEGGQQLIITVKL